MDLLELMKKRRSVRKYQTDKQISNNDLNNIIKAGLYAPNGSGGQKTIIVGIRDSKISEELGRLNLLKYHKDRLEKNYNNKSEPNLIDNPEIENGFYGAPTVCIIFGQKDFIYSIPDSFCCAENMILEATSLGISSCIIGRAEETFDNPQGKDFLEEWNIPDSYIPHCFILLGYCEGPYPKEKPIRPNRVLIVE